MAYYTLSDDGKIHTEVSRAVCLARIDDPNNPFPQRWYVDEECVNCLLDMEHHGMEIADSSVIERVINDLNF